MGPYFRLRVVGFATVQPRDLWGQQVGAVHVSNFFSLLCLSERRRGSAAGADMVDYRDYRQTWADEICVYAAVCGWRCSEGKKAGPGL